MSKTTHRKDHKEKLNKYKNNLKNMSKQQTTKPNAQQYPPIRNVPTWDKDANIVIKGYEWEIIYNGIASMQMLLQAASSVMSRNITDGVIDMDFEKLDPATLTYVEMSPEEKAPYLEDFNKMVQQMRNPVSEEQFIATNKEEKTTLVTEEDRQEAKPEAKIITMQ